ncbi:MAG: DUF1292 domain-containing protein [Christensenellaceae bacterium]|jgi:thioredoxin-related protein|nr:DUF1292 domain-containing protein [Christensenellaceae bacterium]
MSKKPFSNDDIKSEIDEVLDDEVLVFEDEEGNEHEFLVICPLEMDGKEYLALTDYINDEDETDTEKDEDEDEEESGILYFARVESRDEENEEITMVLDEETLMKLDKKFQEYFKIVTESFCDDSDCDCGCDDSDCDHH